MTTNLLEFDLDALIAFCERLGENVSAQRSYFRWIHQRGAKDFGAMSDLAKSPERKAPGLRPD